MRAFGSTFAVVQTVVDVLSAAVVYLVYRISRQLIPAPLPALTSICLVAVGITARTYFSLFSLIGYTPSVHAGAVGVLLMMDAALAYIADGRRRLVRISLGAWVACLSKRETLAAAVLIFILLALGDRKLWFSGKKKQQWLKVYAIQSLSCFLLPLLLYLAWGEVAGWTKFAACLQGFGLSSLACPWWPNGYGLTGAVVALVEGGLVFLLGCLWVPDLRRRLSRRPLLVSACALVAAAGVVAFEWRIFSDLLSGAGGIGQRIRRDGVEFFSTSLHSSPGSVVRVRLRRGASAAPRIPETPYESDTARSDFDRGAGIDERAQPVLGAFCRILWRCRRLPIRSCCSRVRTCCIPRSLPHMEQKLQAGVPEHLSSPTVPRC